MAKKWLLLLLEVNEENFPEGDVYTQIPDKLDSLVGAALPDGALDLQKIYLLNKKQKLRIEQVADATAINYHHHAVSVRGEKCVEACCEQHPTKNVLNFNDHKRQRSSSPGVN